jgi:gentisate 1,2-dioxygenase
MSEAAFATPNIAPCVTYGDSGRSPVFRYPYEDSVNALRHAPPSADGIRRVRYINPLTGEGAMPLLDTLMCELEGEQWSSPMCTNANQVIAVVEGEGESQVGDKRFNWKARDVFTIPQHSWSSHVALSGKARFFVVSDADVLRRLSLLTEQTQAAPC